MGESARYETYTLKPGCRRSLVASVTNDSACSSVDMMSGLAQRAALAVQAPDRLAWDAHTESRVPGGH